MVRAKTSATLEMVREALCRTVPAMSESFRLTLHSLANVQFYRGNRSSRGGPSGATGVRAVLSTIPISE